MKPFFRRKQEERGEISSVWQRDNLPDSLIVQIIQIVKNTTDIHYSYVRYVETYWHKMVKHVLEKMRLELGSFRLSPYPNAIEESELLHCLFHGFGDYDKIDVQLTIIEYMLAYFYNDTSIIDDVNYRFREARVGYQFNSDSKCILPFDDEIIHENAVEPAFHFLNIAGFEKAKNYFKEAYEDFIAKKYEDCLHHTCKSLESVIKNVLKKKKVAFSENDGLSRLIDSLFSENVMPFEHNDFASGLKNIFKEITAERNKKAGHGTEETKKIEISEAKAKLVLNLAASLITYISTIY